MSGSVKEPLFKALMKDLMVIEPTEKQDGLLEFQRHGYFLMDATYLPVNVGLRPTARDNVIRNDFDRLRRDLIKLSSGQEVPLLLIKANVCRILEPLLLEAGFTVINNGIVLPFPSTGRQGEFRERLAEIRRQSDSLVNL